jgi:hypothetical protein
VPSWRICAGRHGLAGVDQDAGADGEVLHELEGEDAARRPAVVEQRDLAGFEIVDGETVGVGGVEGEADFVDGEFESVGVVRLRLGLRGGAG